MEKVVIGISLSAIFRPNRKWKMELVQNSDDKYIEQNSLDRLEKGPLFNFIYDLLNCKKQQKFSFIEVILISDCSPNLAPCIFESLAYYQLEIDDVILCQRFSIVSYLEAVNADFYFSTDLARVREAQHLNIFSGLVSFENLKGNDVRVGLDHRIFSQEALSSIIGKVMPLLGFFQREFSYFKVTLLTTRSYSVESWVKDLFKMSQCKINEVCFLGIGATEDVCHLFDFSIYIEGEKRETCLGPKPIPCLLNIDF